MTEEATCGTGMAAGAALPTRMAGVVAAMADVLTRHTDSLDPEEPAGAEERDAWLRLAADNRQLATRLMAVADRMESQQGLPVAGHDMAVLMSDDATAAFEHLVHAQEQLHALLTEQLVEFRAMLAQMRQAEPGA